MKKLWAVKRLKHAVKKLGIALPVLLVMAALALPMQTARADPPGPDILQSVRFDQKLGDQVPLDLTFKDEWGQDIKLGDLVHDKPVVLTLNYLSCPNLCETELNQLVGSLADLPLNLGKDYTVITVSFDPRDKPSLAMDKKKIYTKRYGRPGTELGWHFLTGENSSIDPLTQAVGFHYAYSAQDDEFAHPTGVIVLTPQGKISRYIYGADYPSNDLRLALAESSDGKISSPVDKILLYCFHYDPAAGRYSNVVLGAVRMTSAFTVLGLGIFLVVLWRRDLVKGNVK